MLTALDIHTNETVAIQPIVIAQSDADKIEGVYGADEDEWEAAANAKLAEYGFKLGDFDEKTGDRYELVQL